ncbi:MAG: GNAT family N-acetyltransferase [Phenylobacterium sp.]|uniref:GNAT family N-acetyltransferase n=1 Tax=Phenylobacterium sp. TaxID=1871053 RepID=UPI0025F40B09|nr:GNAT family N-acetyltransferase [Phenylobacterium sp.]MBA4011546.1 GNAT family N-acetyltransferase [Phenylobacterium sp.]
MDLPVVRLLGAADLAVLGNVAAEVFDEAVDPAFWSEFLADQRHHLVVAIDDGVVVGFASAVHYVHPDKAPQLWINEVGVAPSHQRRGLARRLLDRLLALARELDCSEAWVLTDEENLAARAAYRSAGGEETSGVVMVTFPLR